MDQLSLLRAEIDSYDDQLLELINRRMEAVRKIGELKRAQGSVIYRPEREKAIVERLTSLNNGLLTQKAIEAIFLEIFAVSRNLELPERIAYLGPEGSFTHQAAESRFGANSDYIPLSTIRSVFENVDTERVRFGVVPIENNQEGTVHETIDLLAEKDIKIAAEIPMPIHFALATLGDQPAKIDTIYSKDIAFRQCKRFLEEYFSHSVNLVEVTSTSKAAHMALDNPASAAICSHIAAKMYGLPILFDNIEDSPNNRTRFLIICKRFSNQPSGMDKTSLLVKTMDKPGSLASILQQFKDAEINLSKLESRPARNGDAFKYWFLVDLEGHCLDPKIKEILDNNHDSIRLLGSYVQLC